MSALTPPSFGASTHAWGTYASPTADFFYVDDDLGSVNQYQVAANGMLLPLSSPTINTLTSGAYYDGVESFAIHPSGMFAYAVLESTTADNTNTLHHDLVVFDIGANGQLSYRAGAAAPVESAAITNADWIGMNSAGTRIYVADPTGTGIYQFAIATDGSVSPLANPKVAVGSGTANVGAILVAPSGNSAYAIDYKNNLIWQYSVDSGGGLVAAATSTIAACPGLVTYGNPAFAAFDPLSSYLFVSCTSNLGMRAFSVNADGTLTVAKDTTLQDSPLTANSLLFSPRTFAIVR